MPIKLENVFAIPNSTVEIKLVKQTVMKEIADFLNIDVNTVCVCRLTMLSLIIYLPALRNSHDSCANGYSGFPRSVHEAQKMDDSSVDSRGVQRGSCTLCACAGYDGGVHKKKCENSDCSHPPGKHVNMSNQSQQTATSSCKFISLESTSLHNIQQPSRVKTSVHKQTIQFVTP